MNTDKINAVFFDCWDTVISFTDPDKQWNIRAFQKHAINKDEINWEDVYNFTENFIKDYYSSRLMYEISYISLVNLVVKNFDIKLDCPLETCTHEVLNHLDPKPIDGITDFLSLLNGKEIPYAIISNTIYPSIDTLALIDKLIPEHHFKFFLGSQEVGVKKPNPLFFKTGVKLAGADINKSMYIGDAFYQDVHGSYEAGFKASIWLNHKKKEIRPNDGYVKDMTFYEVDGYKGLIELIKKGIIVL